MNRLAIGPHKVHKYERANISKDKNKPYYVYRCILPNCNHYIAEELIWGKVSICHRCDEQFVVQNKARLKGIKKLYCDNCKDLHWNAKPKSKVDTTVKIAVTDLLTRMGIEPRDE